MKKRLLSLVVFLCLVVSAKAQFSINNPGFFYLDNKHSFNLPQLGIGVDLPAKSGFKVPLLKGKGVFLNLSDTTTYFLDSSYLSESERNLFYFSLDGESEQRAMRLMILQSEGIVDLKAELDKAIKEKKLVIIKSLINPTLGETVGIRIEAEGKYFDQHSVVMGNYFISFAFESDLPKTNKAKYESIVKSLKKKNFNKELETYRVHLAQNEEVEDAIEGNDEIEVEEAEGYEGESVEVYSDTTEAVGFKEGLFDQNTTVEWSEFNLKVDIPQGWTYMLQGDEEMNMSDGKMQLLGKKRSIAFSQFRSDFIYVTVNMYSKDMTDMREHYFEYQAGNAIYSQAFATTMDGMPVDALYYGTKSSGTLGIFFEIDDIQYWISADRATKETLPIINQVFASIRLGDVRSSISEKKPFDDLVLKAPLLHEIIEVKNNPLMLTKPNLGKAFTCNLSAMGIQFSLMDPKEDYTCSLGDKTIDITSDIKEVPSDGGANRLTFYTLKKTLGYTFTKVTKTYDAYDYVKGFITNWSANKEYIVDTAGVQDVNGQNWSVCIAQQLGVGYIGMFTTYHHNYEVMVYVASPHRADIIEEARVLTIFKFE